MLFNSELEKIHNIQMLDSYWDSYLLNPILFFKETLNSEHETVGQSSISIFISLLLQGHFERYKGEYVICPIPLIKALILHLHAYTW